MRLFAGRTARVRLALIYSGVFLALAITKAIVVMIPDFRSMRRMAWLSVSAM